MLRSVITTIRRCDMQCLISINLLSYLRIFELDLSMLNFSTRTLSEIYIRFIFDGYGDGESIAPNGFDPYRRIGVTFVQVAIRGSCIAVNGRNVECMYARRYRNIPDITI